MRKGKKQNLNPGLKTPSPMLSLSLPELPLRDLVRAAIFFYLLVFRNNLHVPSPKRKLQPPGAHPQRPEPPHSNKLAPACLLLKSLPLNSGKDYS